MPFFTRPNFEDRQIVQRNGDTITLSGETNIDTSGQFIIKGVTLDFTGTTTASTLYTVAGVSGYINQGNVSGLKIEPPILLISGSTGTTTVDVTGYYLGALNSGGSVTWIQLPSSVTASTTTIQFTGNTSASCITDLYVKNINSCSPLHIQNISSGDVLIGENGGVNVGIGTSTPNYKLHVSGNTRSENNVNGDVSLISINTNNGGTLARGVLAASAIADISGRILSGLFTTSGYNTDLSGFNFGDGGSGYLKNALTISVAGNNPRGDINIGTRNPNKFLRFFSGTDDFDSGSLRGSLNSSGYWGFGQNMTGQTAIVHVKGGGSSSLTNSLKIDNSSNSPLLYVRDDGNVGIGVENPTEKLHISGNTKITGGLNIGTIGSGSPLINLGLDSNGNVVTGTTTSSGGSGTFTGGTGSCITDLYVTNIHGCSPYGISLSSVPGGSMTASTIILTTTNSTNFGLPLTGGSQQGEIVFGIPNLDTGLPLGVMGTGLGSQTVPYGTPGVDYNPVFISTPRSRAYDNTSYSSIKNVLFGGGSDNSVYSSVTNSALIGGSYNSVVKSSDVSILGGTGNTINSSPFSSILAGQLNTIIGELNSTGTTNSSTIIGGTNNLISTQTPGYWNLLPILSGTGQANNSSIIGGENNSIYGHKNSIILGGENNLIHFDFPIFSNKNESIIGSSSCYVIGATNSFINSSSGSTIYYTNYSGVLGGTNNKIQQSDNSGILFGTNNSLAFPSIATLTINSVIVGGSYNYVVPGTESSVIIGGNNITASTDNTVYVPDLVVKKSASIPTSSGSTVGEVGSITWDENYFYVKTLSGWGRTLLDYSF